MGLLGGCAAAAGPLEAREGSPPWRYEEPLAAGALVFDPPVTFGLPPLELAREGRTPDAVVSYDSLTASYFWVRTDDHQSSRRHDRFERRAVMTRVGVSYR